MAARHRLPAADAGSRRLMACRVPYAPARAGEPTLFETGHPYGHDQFISTMGESMAVIALATALGPAKSAKPVLRESDPTGIEPWVETLLFGTPADVKKLLDGGFNPNSATQAGGVTALMLVVPDVEKMKLFIARGANPEARAKDHYSALLVAAQYPGSSAAMNLLLDHGAKVRLPKGQGTPLFNAFPVFLAAYSGNAAMIHRSTRKAIGWTTR